MIIVYYVLFLYEQTGERYARNYSFTNS